MSDPRERRRVAAQSSPLFRQIRGNFVRAAAHLKAGNDSLVDLLDYTRLREEVERYRALNPHWLARLRLDLMDVHHPDHRPLFENFRQRCLEEYDETEAPRPLYWGENKEQCADPAPRVHDFGLHYRCNVAVLDQGPDEAAMVGNWVLSFAADIPEDRPAPAIEMQLTSLCLVPEWQGLGLGSAVSQIISRLVCQILEPALDDNLPHDLPAPPAMLFDSEYISRNGQRMGRQMSRDLAPLAREHGLLFYDTGRLTQRGREI